MRPTRRFKRALRLESLENRRMFVVEIAVQPPIVSAFLTSAEIRGLTVELSTQPVVTQTIDNAGVRQAAKTIDGVIYSFQGSNVFQTNATTGVTTTLTLTGLPGSTGVQIRDVASLEGNIVYVGGSTTGNNSPTKSTIPTMWSATGTPTRIGPAGKTGIANFVLATGMVGGFYEKVDNEYTPWISLGGNDFDLPGGETPTDPQMITGGTPDGFFLVGFENNTPMLWQSKNLPQTGEYDLVVSPEFALEYPAGATLSSAGRNFKVLQDSSGTTNIFGQYEVPIIVQGNVTGSISHAAMWSLSGELLTDFGANSEMLGAQVIDTTFVVAHRNSVSLVNFIKQYEVTTRSLDSLLGSQPPAGTTRKILNDGLLLTGTSSTPQLGINYSETTGSTTRNKLSLVSLKTPDQVQLDIDNDGQWDTEYFGSAMFAPVFQPLGYGQKTLAARVTYSDGSTANAVTTYESLRFEAINVNNSEDLYVGGTAAGDTAAITQLGDGNFRASIGGQTRDFQSIDNVIVSLSSDNDTLVLAGGISIDMTSLSDIEKIDTMAPTVETIQSIDATMVENQVGPTGTLVIQAGIEDSLGVLPGWKIEAPELHNGRATARLTSDGKTLLLETDTYKNPVNGLDTTYDGFVTARDALLVINHLNSASGGTVPVIDAYLDVNGNGTITALDVLLIINDINSRPGGEGESSVVEGQPAAVISGSTSEPAAIPVDMDELNGPRRRRIY